MKLLPKISIFLFLLFQLSSFAFAETDAKEPSLLVKFNTSVDNILFFDVSDGNIQIDEVDRTGNPILDQEGNAQKKTIKIPFLIVFLVTGALFFTFWYRWINIRFFSHALQVVRGKYDNPKDEGEISHFRALTSALSATVGLGNIAGVAVAIQLGGPGAVFWMLITAIFGMSAKFSSCTLSQLYRKKNEDGSISGGPMYYLDLGLKEMGHIFIPLGKILGIMYAIMVMGGALGGGNMFQVNQTAEAFRNTFGWSDAANPIIGGVMLVLVAAVILGGVKRIGAATSKIIPFMCGIYVIASIVIILSNIDKVPESFSLIFNMAFSDNAFFGGLLGVLVIGVTRAAFSNEAGLGSAAIVHAAAKTEEPVREGMVAMLGPFIDTIIVCLMTSLVVIITGAWNDPNIPASAGVALTTTAFGKSISWFPYVLTLCIGLFAYSTMISWCYYGERGWIYLLDHLGGIGLKSVVIFRIIFIVFIYIGSVHPLKDVLDFSDLMILSMALPNIIGSILLAPKVFEKVKDYIRRYKANEFETFK